MALTDVISFSAGNSVCEKQAAWAKLEPIIPGILLPFLLSGTRACEKDTRNTTGISECEKWEATSAGTRVCEKDGQW